MLIATAPVALAVPSVVNESSDPPFQSKPSQEPAVSVKPTPEVAPLVARAVPSARLKAPPLLTASVPAAGMLLAPLSNKVPALTVVPPE